MRKLVLTTVLLLAVGGLVGQAAQAKDKQHHSHTMKQSNKWIHKWDRLDHNIYSATHIAAGVYGASESTLNYLVNREGGSHSPATLRKNICVSYHGAEGWNVTADSAAFGPFQFMMNYRAACFNSHAWGTFGSYYISAYERAKQLGVHIPFRYMNPASNVGQAMTAAYMLSRGYGYHWGL